MYCMPQVICVLGLVAQSSATELILEPGSAWGMP